MKTIKLSRKQIENLELFDVPKGISNTEGTLYRLKVGIKKIDEQDLLFKKLFVTQDRVIEDEEYGFIYTNNVSNKYNTISKLSDFGSSFNIDELVIPRHQVDVSGEVVGFTVPEIKNAKSLQKLMEDYNTPLEDKIYYLKQIGELLRKIEKLNKNDINFYIHDLHEANFLVDENKKIHVVDLDSASFSKETALPSKYIAIDKKIDKYKKYKFNKHRIPYPSEDIDLYCYTVMILNTLYEGNITKLSEKEFYDYLSYLIEIKFPYEFVNTLAQIYHDGKNVNPVDYLDDINSNQQARANKNVYKLVRNKK